LFGRIWDTARIRGQEISDKVSQNPLASKAIGIGTSSLLAGGMWTERCYHYEYLGWWSFTAGVAVTGFLGLCEIVRRENMKLRGPDSPDKGDLPPDEPPPSGFKPNLDKLLGLDEIWKMERPKAAPKQRELV
jgi:hypothetical protein